MRLKGVLCYAVLTVTLATHIQATAESNDTEENKLQKKISRRATTLVVEGPPPGRFFHQPKAIYKRLSHKSYSPPRTATYRPRRTKYGPSRTLRKPGMKYRGKGPKHSPFPYKKRAIKPRYGPNKKPSNAGYAPPKKTPHRIYSGVGFGEPPSNYKKYRPPKPTEFSRPHKPFKNTYKEIVPKPIDIDFSSPGTFDDNFSNKPFEDDFVSEDVINSFPKAQGYGEPPMDFAPVEHSKTPMKTFGGPIKSADSPVDSYGAPIQPNLHDLTFSTVQTFIEPTSHLNEEFNFGPKSRPWNDDFIDESDTSYAQTKRRPAFAKLEESEDIYVTPRPQEEQENIELSLNSYSDIYNYRQTQDNKKKKKKKSNYYQNVKMLNHPWKGAKLKESSEEIIVGGQYAEPPARYVAKSQRDTPVINDEDSVFAPTINFPHSDQSASSYVNYKNSNLAFSPQNLNDVFSIVDK